jgi:hypothetical protein
MPKGQDSEAMMEEGERRRVLMGQKLRVGSSSASCSILYT